MREPSCLKVGYERHSLVRGALEMNTVVIQESGEVTFQEMMDRSYKKVFNLAYRLSGNRADAEDLTQEAFFRAYRSFHSYEGDRPFENWIFRIVTRLFLDMKRAKKRRVKTVSSDSPLTAEFSGDTVMFESADNRPSPEETLLSEHLSEDLEHSLAHLSAEQRELIWMADVEQVPYSEIAARFSAPVGTIRSRLHRAHKQLRKVLEQVRAGTCSTCGAV